MMRCEEAVRRLWEYLDGTLGTVDRQRVEEHLERCQRCCGEMEFAHELRGFLHRARDTDGDLPQEVLRRLVTKVEELDP